MDLTAIILTCNEEENLPACLESIQGLGCAIFVVDSGSTDQTCALATAAGARVVKHRFENYAAQRNWAQRNLPIKTEWVLHLDADERLTPELAAEISVNLSVNGKATLERIDGFLFRKRTLFMGRWIRHGGHYPSHHLRLFRKDNGFCEDRLYDQHFVVNGKIATLKHDYLDVLNPDLNTWTRRHLRWAELEARELGNGNQGNAQVHPSLLGNPIERRRWLRTGLYGRAPLFIRPFAYWIYRYFFRFGFLDGKEGFIFHFLQGLWFRLLVDVKIDELRRAAGPERLGDDAVDHTESYPPRWRGRPDCSERSIR